MYIELLKLLNLKNKRLLFPNTSIGRGYCFCIACLSKVHFALKETTSAIPN